MLKFKKMENQKMLKSIKNSLIFLPSPMNISYLWNFGSMLGMCLMTQILSGLFLAMHYSPTTKMAFQSVIHISRDVNMGWLMRIFHANGASFFFLFIFIHIGRGMYFKSYNLKMTWMMGIIILFMSMASAFLGYVLPWGQMSFWGATVITNLLSAIPYIGTFLVNWIWGGFSVDNATLNRFFVFHFILPILIVVMVLFHLIFLHEKGSNNPLGISSNSFKIPFKPFFFSKDLVGFMMMFLLMMIVNSFFPYKMGDPDNFLIANPMVTPIHIKPEWYFLFAYAILRSIPNKLGGVMALAMSIIMLIFLPLLNNNKKKQNKQFLIIQQNLFWLFFSTFLILTWAGGKPVEEPYIFTSQIFTIMYFMLILTQ